VRNGEARLVDRIGVRVGVQVVAEQTEERDDPGIAGDCGRRTPPVPLERGGIRRQIVNRFRSTERTGRSVGIMIP
jgi:hypothetical protein